MKTILLIEVSELMLLSFANYHSSDYEVHSLAFNQGGSRWIKYQHTDLILADFPQKEDEVEMNRLRAQI
jgi:hypothetical protein